MIKRKIEIITGLVAILFACFFLLYAMFSIGINLFKKEYTLVAYYNNANSLTSGTRVKYKGIDIGYVKDISIRTPLYDIEVVFKIKSNAVIPSDSTFVIAAPLLFGDTFIDVKIGSASTYLKHNDTIKNTEDFISLEDRIGSFFIQDN